VKISTWEKMRMFHRSTSAANRGGLLRRVGLRTDSGDRRSVGVGATSGLGESAASDVHARISERIPRSFARPGADLPRVRVADFDEMKQRKVDLIAGSVGIESLRDFGGLYAVYGKYLLEPAVRLNCRFASMIDGTPRVEFGEKTAQAKAENPGLAVEYIRADFRDPALYASLSVVDASILYEVLLHQENYVQVVKSVISRTTKSIFFTQPCLREGLFPIPAAAVLLQFYPDALKEVLRSNCFWPIEPAVDTYAPQYWMWGQTTSNIITIFQGFGWELDRGEVIENLTGDFWEYPLLRFRPRR
jgi:hypothetical protein